MEVEKPPPAVQTQCGSPSTALLREDEEIEIYLRLTQTVPLKVKRSDTIENLKTLIQQKDGISKSVQDLFFDGKLLMDREKLEDCGILWDSILHLNVPSRKSVQIFVIVLSYRKTIVLEAAIYDTVRDVKLVIRAKEGTQLGNFVLYYGVKLLEDDMTLASCNMRTVSDVFLVFRPKAVISISVRAPDGQIVKLQVKCMLTIRAVIDIVEGMIDDSVDDGILFHAGEQLDDHRTLASYEIKSESLLKLLPACVQIFVKTWIGKTLTLKVKQCDTVEYIKIEVFNRLLIPVHLQSIVYAGKSLENDRTMESYNIQHNSTLHMVLVLSQTMRDGFNLAEHRIDSDGDVFSVL